MSYRAFRESALDKGYTLGPEPDAFREVAGNIAIEFARTAFLGGSDEWPTSVDVGCAIRMDLVRRNLIGATYRIALDVALQFSALVPALEWPDLGGDLEAWVRDYAGALEVAIERLRKKGLAK